MKALAAFSAILFCISITVLADEQVHILKKNETLYRISRQYNVAIEAILKANNIDDPTVLRVGRKITIPNSYVVTPGDTLYGIARRNNTTIERLLEFNNLAEGYVLKVDDVILLPNREPVQAVNSARQSETAGSTSDPGETDQNEQIADQSGEKGTENRSDHDELTNNDISDKELSLQRELFWPVSGKIRPYEGKLSGTRIEGERGDPVVSISSGEVVWVGPYRGFGNVILIQSPDRFIYVYGGNEKTNVTVGETVNPGMEIGILGIHPHGEKPVLFFTVFKDGKPVDPEKAPRI